MLCYMQYVDQMPAKKARRYRGAGLVVSDVGEDRRMCRGTLCNIGVLFRPLRITATVPSLKATCSFIDSLEYGCGNFVSGTSGVKLCQELTPLRALGKSGVSQQIAVRNLRGKIKPMRSFHMHAKPCMHICSCAAAAFVCVRVKTSSQKVPKDYRDASGWTSQTNDRLATLMIDRPHWRRFRRNCGAWSHPLALPSFHASSSRSRSGLPSMISCATNSTLEHP